jgi:DNA-binding transcriptional regulator GbsR (MarR family)
VFSVFIENTVSNEHSPPADWTAARDEFVAQWGSLGTQWGINRTMAQIHALLLISPTPLSTDDVMETLQVSRGNAHSNLKELVGWELVRSVPRKGERREFFEAEKDLWTVFLTVARQRARREIEPAVRLLENCATRSEGASSDEGRLFHQQMVQLSEFIGFGLRVSDCVQRLRYPAALQFAMRLFPNSAAPKPPQLSP